MLSLGKQQSLKVNTWQSQNQFLANITIIQLCPKIVVNSHHVVT